MRNWTRQERIALVALIVGFITAIAYDELRCLLGLIDCVPCSRFPDADDVLFARVFLLWPALWLTFLLAEESMEPSKLLTVIIFILPSIIFCIGVGSILINSCG